MKANPKGVAGEDYAAAELEKLGYKIVCRNFHSRFGEVDIIAEKDEIIAFVEVKARKADGMVTGFEAVTAAKQRKIIATALWYLARYHSELQPRFDVFSVTTGKKGEIISHDYLEGAFDGGAYYKKHN